MSPRPVVRYPERRSGSYTPPKASPGEPRMFFECSDCGYFHESVLILACAALTNRFLLGDVPCGGPTPTEVHYLDGHIERMPAG